MRFLQNAISLFNRSTNPYIPLPYSTAMTGTIDVEDAMFGEINRKERSYAQTKQ